MVTEYSNQRTRDSGLTATAVSVVFFLTQIYTHVREHAVGPKCFEAFSSLTIMKSVTRGGKERSQRENEKVNDK